MSELASEQQSVKGNDKEIKAALIDLDGLLINSEELYLKANKIYFKRQFGFDFTEGLHRQGTGKKFEQWIKTVVQTEKSGEEILRERNKVYFEIARQELKLMPGVLGFLETLRERKVRTALVTSSNRDYVNFVFEITNIGGFFDEVITGDEITKGKPDPEGYLQAAKRLGVAPGGCVVFEDAPSGILAGKNAFMRVVAVPSPFVKGDPIFLKTDLVLDNLSDVLKLENWLESQS